MRSTDVVDLSLFVGAIVTPVISIAAAFAMRSPRALVSQLGRIWFVVLFVAVGVLCAWMARISGHAIGYCFAAAIALITVGFFGFPSVRGGALAKRSLSWKFWWAPTTMSVGVLLMAGTLVLQLGVLSAA